jgi:predicted outer membrane repeat protein
VRGSVLSPQSNFQFKGDFENQKVFTMQDKGRPCGGCKINTATQYDPRPRSGAQTKHAWRDADAGLIDLMVVCPVAVQNAIGGRNESLAEINNAVAGANLCFRNSQLQIQLRLVHVYESTYSPTSNLDIDLDRLTNKNDGHLDEVHTLRDQYGADVVTLLSTDSDMGGLANTLSYPSLSFEESAFNVCVWDQIGAPVFTLAHEIGHNMGCLHNREDASDSSQDSNYDYGAFAYGKRWYLNGEGYRTVMAYNDSGKNFDNSIPYFSNPSVSYLGVKTGNTGTEDNAKALRISSPYVSNFRESKVQGIIPSVFSTDVHEGGTRTIWARLATEPMSETQVNLSLSNQQDFFLGSASSLKFDRNNWNLRQPIQIIGVPDSDTIDESGTLTFANDNFSSLEITLTGKDSGNQTLTSMHYFSGMVVNPFGVGMDGVTLTFSNEDSDIQSDLNGTFITSLREGVSVTVTPSKVGYSFQPSSLTIENVTDHSLKNIFVGSRSRVVYVDQRASGLDNGTSWGDAFRELSTALELVDDYSEIWVAAGTYSPGSVRSGSFVLPGNIQVLGGFKGNETSSSNRDFTENETVLSGNIGDSSSASDNSFHVIVPLDGAILDGFIIKDGNATENYSDDRGKGGGLWAQGVKFEIRNCEFLNNWAFQGGGGVWLQEVNATFDHCKFTSNATGGSGSGGAIWSNDSNLTLESCSFVTNQSGFWGGALRVDDGNLTITDCLLSGNESKFSNGGGGLYQNAGSFLIENTSFLQNKASHQGGAILMRDASGSILDSNFTENHNVSSNGGGALYIENSSPKISSSKFIKNKTDANNYGGAIKLLESNSKISNCIFKYNQNTKNSGGAIYIDQSSNPELEDNEFYYNFSASRGGAIFCESEELSLINGLFLGNWAKNGGGVATYGTIRSSFTNLKILGNEANASSRGSGGFLNLGSGSASSKFINCIIAGNKSNYRDGVFSPHGATRFLQCTIVGNQAGVEGGVALMFSTDSIELENSIMWQNTAPKVNDIWVNAGQAFANYSLFDPSRSEGDITGLSNINQDPLFFDLEGADKSIGTLDDDLRLLLSSPAKDVGNPQAMELPPNDIVGLQRDGLPDLGAYEFFENAIPVYLGLSDFNVYEGNSSITVIKASDADGHPLVFSIIGGKDEDRISVGSVNGILYFNATPDYEYPEDSNGDNIYEILLGISDRYTSLQLQFTINILDLDETAKSPEDSNLLINGYSIGNNWNQASWFGTYYSQFFPWVYHSSMGWLYIVQSKDGDTWMWKDMMEWVWTDLDVFPYFFIQSSQQWGYVGSGSQRGQYYLFETGNSGWVDF